jgi:hypothetical protein
MFLGQSHHYKNSSHRHDLAKLLQNIPKNSSRRHDRCFDLIAFMKIDGDWQKMFTFLFFNFQNYDGDKNYRKKSNRKFL